jgi:hypothetical protein
MTEQDRVLRQIRGLLTGILFCCASGLCIAFLVLFMPDTYRWLLAQRVMLGVLTAFFTVLGLPFLLIIVAARSIFSR